MLRKILSFLILLNINYSQSIFWQDDFSNPSQWSLNSNVGTNVTPSQGGNDPKYNPWVINADNFFTPSGPISGNSLKITIQPGTDFDGLGLAAGLTGYDPFDVNEPNLTDALALLNTNIDATGKTGIILQFDYQTGGWLGDDYGTVLYSIDGGVTWTELDNSVSVQVTTLDANNNLVGGSTTFPAAPSTATDQNAFSNIDGVSSGTLWHTARIFLPAVCDNQPDLRIGFRWRNIVHTSNSPDYVGVSFNVDNIKLLVNPPQASYTFSPSSPCAGQTITFDGSASTPGGGTNITEYLWEFPGGTPSTASTTTPTVSVTYNTPGQYFPRLRVVNNNNDTSDYYSLQLDVANCKPTAIINGPTQACRDSAISFSDLSINMTSAYGTLTWDWTFTSGTPATATGQGPHSVTWNSLGQYTVTLSVSNDYGTDDTTITVDVIDCSCNSASSSVILWTETFGTGCNDGNLATTYGWSVYDIGLQGADANEWYVSASENGQGAGNCGAGCGTNRTLHVGPVDIYWFGFLIVTADGGARYYADPGGETDKRAVAPAIDVTGYKNITVEFEYMENGEGATDNAWFCYSTDGGTSWTDIDLAKTEPSSCSPQGLWTAQTPITLPPAADNISNLLIGFRWANDGNSLGSDPSFAVDNIIVRGDPISGGGVVFTGAVNNDWHTGGNWSTGNVPLATDDVQIPAGKLAIISTGNAVGNNICNFGTIEIQNDNTLSVYASLLNEGTIRTTTSNMASDVIFTGATCVYKGSGVNIDADYEIGTGSSTTLQANLSCRSLIHNGDLIWTDRTITLKGHLIVNSVSATNNINSVIVFDGPCTSCVYNSGYQMMDGAQTGFVIPNMIVRKDLDRVEVLNDFTVNNLLKIEKGILDQSLGLISGTGDLQMTDGEYRMANPSPTILPALTGVYTLQGGKVTLYANGNQILRNTDYFKLHFDGTGIKTLNGNVNVRDSLLFTLPTSTGNYVDAGTFTLREVNADPNIVYRTGGHVVGRFARDIVAGNTYRFYVGSTGTGTTTYYEPIDITTDAAFSGPAYITTQFLATVPNPATLSLTELGATFTNMQPEGYWEVISSAALSAGSYSLTQYPSSGWVFGSTSYTQVKQSAGGSPWTFDGSLRVTALKRKNYTAFSNFGIAYSSDPLALKILLSGIRKADYNLLQANIFNKTEGIYILQRSEDMQTWRPLPVSGMRQAQSLIFKDFTIQKDKIYYYRLAFKDTEGKTHYSNITELSSASVDVYFSLHPIPFNEVLYITTNSTEPYSVKVYDVSGKEIFSRQNISGNAFLPTEKWNKGVYFLKISGEEISVTRKIVK